MNYTIRDKNGKNLGSFGIPTLIEMVKNSRLSGDEQFYSPHEQDWKPLEAIQELAPFLAANMPPGMAAGAPVDFSDMFSDLGLDDPGSEDGQPDFTLPGAPPADQSTTSTTPSDNCQANIDLELPDISMATAPPGSADPGNSLDSLWVDDNEKPVLQESGPQATVIGAPPGIGRVNEEKTLMGPPPSAKVNQPALDSQTVFGAPPVSSSPPNRPDSPLSMYSGDDPLQDLLGSAPPGTSDNAIQFSQEPGGIPKEGLEDLFSAPDKLPELQSEKKPLTSESLPSPKPDDALTFPGGTSPEASENILDSLLNASPDVFAADLTMPESSPPPAPSEPKIPPASAKSVKTSTPPSLNGEKRKEKALPTQKEGKLAALLDNLREQFQEKGKVFLIGGLVLLLGAGGGTVYFFFMRTPLPSPAAQKPKDPSDANDQSPTGGPNTALENYGEIAQKLRSRDNYGSYLQASQVYEKTLSSFLEDSPEKQKLNVYIVENLSRAKLLNPLPAEWNLKLENYFKEISAISSPDADNLRAQGAFYLTQNDIPLAKEKLDQALNFSSNDHSVLNLLGILSMREKNLEQAKDFFDQALQKNPADISTLYILSQITHQQKSESSDYEQQLQKVLEYSKTHIAGRVDLGIYYFEKADFKNAEENLALITGTLAKEAHSTDTAKAHYYLGLISQAQDLKKEAGNFFNKAVELNPDHPEYLHALGNALLEQDKISEAQTRFVAAMQLDPKNASYKVGLAKTYIRENKIGKALEALQVAIENNPTHYDAYLQLGLVKKENKEFDVAVSYLRNSQKYKEKNLEATLALAEIFTAQKRYNLAITEYRNAIVIDPKSQKIHVELGRLFMLQENYIQAATQFESAIQYTSDEKERGTLYYELGKAFQGARQYDKAIEAHRTARSLQINFVEAYTGLGVAYYHSKRWEEAIETLESAKDMSPPKEIAIELYFYLGSSYLEVGDAPNTLSSYDKILALEPHNSQVHFKLGEYYMKRNIYQKAVEEFEISLRGLSKNEQYPVYLKLGECYQALEETNKAFQIYQKTRLAYPKRAEPYFRIGRIYEEQQQVNKAILFYKENLKYDPQNDRAHVHLAYSYKSLNQMQLALNHFKWALKINPEAKNAMEIKSEIEILTRMH